MFTQKSDKVQQKLPFLVGNKKTPSGVSQSSQKTVTNLLSGGKKNAYSSASIDSNSNSSSDLFGSRIGQSNSILKRKVSSGTDSIPNPRMKKIERGGNESGGISGLFKKNKESKMLSVEQKNALDFVVNKRMNVFITGSAGTGKSVLLANIVSRLLERESYSADRVAVTAPTGIAAYQLRGQTIHSWAGVGIGKDSVEKLESNILKRREARERWASVQVLIIDEVSMLDALLFEKLEQLARRLKRSSKPFGGIQLCINFGLNKDDVLLLGSVYGFVFESPLWEKVVAHEIVLTRVFRQRDMEFIDMLNEIRLGKMRPETQERLSMLSREPKYPNDGIKATELYSLRSQVEGANIRSLNQLPGSVRAYHSANFNQGVSITNEEVLNKMDNACRAARKVELKVNAQVMLINNMSNRNLVNGSRGVVVGFDDVNGEGYPICRFINGVEFTVTPEEYEIELSNQRYVRVQLPLVLAWALSIHKSQGQTIDRVKVDLGNVFEKGQAYVALSRATSLDGLQILNFHPSKVFSHSKVLEFYARLSRRRNLIELGDK
ncbi:ATP-dependent DNA helicase pfh1 [Zancudomyces culisetae]|uniref:ATP-dependent DNA helicase n=1 Tax=Zancudomyces culisetae TaxID=1213189 RepID=A0A1R1PYG3_ZANCU|nr:ATP-dependent DNA helicase pfh1 [Zancudomyces culisetae]|eukprot:OMH85967.1 ATP-dependent DNA helicase pfh1 [Zancudomyces culisetae]